MESPGDEAVQSLFSVSSWQGIEGRREAEPGGFCRRRKGRALWEKRSVGDLLKKLRQGQGST